MNRQEVKTLEVFLAAARPFGRQVSAEDLAADIHSRVCSRLRDGIFLLAADEAEAESFASDIEQRLADAGLIVLRTSAGKRGRCSAYAAFRSSLRRALENSVSNFDENAAYSEVFQALVRKYENDLVLLIENADCFGSRGSDRKELMALKAARDAVNLSPEMSESTAFVIGIGINRERLRAMVSSRDEPFFGADAMTIA